MKVKGFTLIELIVTLLIGSILLAWGVPNYRDFKLRRMVSDNANNISYAMNLARAEAVRYGTNVVVERTGTSWEEGWTITAIGVGGSPDTLLAQEDLMDNGMILELQNAPQDKVEFNRLGGLVRNNVAQFELRHNNMPNFRRNIFITMSGNVRVVEI